MAQNLVFKVSSKTSNVQKKNWKCVFNNVLAYEIGTKIKV